MSIYFLKISVLLGDRILGKMVIFWKLKNGLCLGKCLKIIISENLSRIYFYLYLESFY